MSDKANRILSKRQREVLEIMLYQEEELACEGREAWIADQRTSVPMVLSLLRLCAISEDTFSGNTYRIFSINQTGKELLNGVVSDELTTVLRQLGGSK